MGGAFVLGRLFARVRPLAPIIAVTVLLSLLYSMVLFVALQRSSVPPLPVADPLEPVLPERDLRHRPGSLIGPLAVSIHDHRVQTGAGRLVNAYLDGRPSPTAGSRGSSSSA